MPDPRGIVLVVDDDEDWLETLSDFLAEEGYSVVVAPNGLTALDRLAHMQPVAVVTDIQMPIMDGRQLLPRIHARDVHVPVIVVTGTRPEEDDASLEQAFRIIRKPVPVEELLSALEAAKAHRVAHLPLQKLWLAAGATRRRRANVSRSRLEALRGLGSSMFAAVSSTSAMRVAMFAIVVASSFALFKHLRSSLG